MITPELISYIRGELTKGRKREEIREGLVREGGWGEADLSEAFRITIPMQGSADISHEQKTKSPSLSSLPLRKIYMVTSIILVIGGLGFAGWFYRVPLLALWNSGVNKISALYTSYFSPKISANTDTLVTNEVPQNIPIVPEITIKDCGVGTAPDLKKPLTYQDNSVLTCLGESALLCENAKAVLIDPLFPSIFQVVRNEGSCDFKLSYPEDSTLVDATGAKLAGQYISCPVFTVKAVDESKKVPVFSSPSTDNLGKYAGQIYFYGTLGLFIESNLDQNKIRAIGCSGAYIDSVISSYRKMQSKQ